MVVEEQSKPLRKPHTHEKSPNNQKSSFNNMGNQRNKDNRSSNWDDDTRSQRSYKNKENDDTNLQRNVGGNKRLQKNSYTDKNSNGEDDGWQLKPKRDIKESTAPPGKEMYECPKPESFKLKSESNKPVLKLGEVQEVS